MATIKTPQEILQIAAVAQALAFKDQATKQLFQSGYKPSVMPTMICIEKACVQWMYDYAPANPALQGIANYLYGLLGSLAIRAENILANLDQAAPVVTGANDDSVEDGETATFTIGVISTLPYTIAWYNQDGIIPGATSLSYSFTAVLADTGSVYYAVVTDSAGQSTQSVTGTLTVTQTIEGEYFFGDIDYYAELSAGDDNITYNGSFSITNGDPLVVDFTSGAENNKFNGIKYPIAQGAKSAWENTPLNSGFVPDSVYRAVITIGSNLYIISRNAMSLDSTTQVVTFS